MRKDGACSSSFPFGLAEPRSASTAGGCFVAASVRDSGDMDRRATAVKLAQEGVSRSDICDRLTAAPSTVRGWITDPDGSRAQQRRAGYGAGCERCGTATTGNRPGGARSRCRRCAGARARRWSKPLIRRRVLAWNRRYGRWPRSSDWNATRARERGGSAWARWSGGRWPPASTVTRVYSRFALAVEDAKSGDHDEPEFPT